MTIKVFDTFTGSNGTDIDAHTPDTDVVGGGWVDGGANTVELDGSGGLKFAGSNNECWIDAGTTEQLVTSNFNAGGADNRVIISVRGTNAGASSATHYIFNFRMGDATNPLQISKNIAGSVTTLASSSGTPTLSNNTTYELKANAVGSSLDFLVDGISELSTTDASITTGGYSGLRHALHTDGAARFFDFEVDDGVIDGTGVLSSGDSVVSGAGQREHTGTGVLVSDDSTVSGTGQREHTGTGALVSEDSTVTASGTIGRVGIGVLVADDSIVAGTGKREHTGTSSLASDDSLVSGSGSIGGAITGTGSLVAADSAVSGIGLLGHIGTSVLVTSDATVSGIGQLEHTSIGALIASDCVVSGSGAIEGGVTGTGALASADSTVSGNGQREHTGTGSLVSGDSVVAGTGKLGHTGTGALASTDSTVVGLQLPDVVTPDSRRGSVPSSVRNAQVSASIRNKQVVASPSRLGQPEE